MRRGRPPKAPEPLQCRAQLQAPRRVEQDLELHQRRPCARSWMRIKGVPRYTELLGVLTVVCREWQWVTTLTLEYRGAEPART